MRNTLFVLLLFVFLPSCSSGDEEGIRDSRDNYMMELQNALSKNNIPFKIDSEGYIRYSKKHSKFVEKIKQNVDEQTFSEVGTKFNDEQSTKYFRKLLDESKISYRIKTRKNSEWTYWHPENKNQENEFEGRVVMKYFEGPEAQPGKLGRGTNPNILNQDN